jgi:DNA-binding CsgD family transcriptional regulator
MGTHVAPARPVYPTVDGARDDAGLRSTLRLVHSPLDYPPREWRGEVARSLKHLLGADSAACLLWQNGGFESQADELEPEIIREYLDYFAPVDSGMQRRDVLGLALWSRQLLWDPGVLARSEYYNEFALPRSIHDTIGVSVDLDELPAHLRIVLVYRHGSLGPDACEERLTRLDPLFPALRTGLGLQLGFQGWLGRTAMLLDKIGERLLLFSLGGRELYRSASMRRTLDEDPCRDRLQECLRQAARAVAGVTQPGRPAPSGEIRAPAGARQQVEGGSGHFGVRACLVGPGIVGPDTMVLVTMDPVGPLLPPPDLLHGRYALTPREIQVADLLVQRMTNSEIAATLGISAHTARHHTESVLLKTHVNSRRALRHLLAKDL